MTDTLAIARRTLLETAQLDSGSIDRVLDGLMKPGVDAADLYFQQSLTETWSLEDGIVKSGANHAEQGVGVRACAGEKQGLAYSDALELPALIDAAQAAGAIVRQGQQGRVQAVAPRSAGALYPAIDPVGTLAVPDKLDLLQRADRAARAADSRVVQVMASLAANAETVLIACSDGTRSADVRPLVRMDVSVIVEHNGRREQGHAGAGGRGAYLDFLGSDRPERLAQEAVRMALVALEAVPAPAGTLTVVLGPGWPGVLLHEAIGHGLEGDFNRRGSSAFSGRIGQTVASPLCTVVDDGTLPGRRGSLSVDDEGTPSQCTTLIENGVLRGYIQDKLNARLMGVAPTGNGRRESYAALPMPRMTNTYMLPGPHDPQEIVASVDNGIYAANFGGGQVDITSGNFVFSASEAYLIENGRITRPVKGATLIGNGPEVLTRVSMVGSDLQLDAGIGVCGKDGQSVPVGVGQPTLKIDGLTVGGTA
ncbi:metalloprotease TldD [Sinimarinibacterium flocculans]|uniref:Microcin-processing peptidase 2 n=1 Tax=Sinimarinibacterium flocculans TaxID=985250 RepID=A0A318EFV7_9GAMM|nr:metalloprotease TldD [Sinimarinibacterium flocculans]PXV69606.1 microcin-processing peptidase 2 [Sinimarinibacterium flocculans]